MTWLDFYDSLVCLSLLGLVVMAIVWTIFRCPDWYRRKRLESEWHRREVAYLERHRTDTPRFDRDPSPRPRARRG